jgi:hypothetical protein
MRYFEFCLAYFFSGKPGFIQEKHLNLAMLKPRALFSEHSLAPTQEQVDLLKGTPRYECLQTWVTFDTCICSEVCNGGKQTFKWSRGNDAQEER